MATFGMATSEVAASGAATPGAVTARPSSSARALMMSEPGAFSCCAMRCTDGQASGMRAIVIYAPTLHANASAY